MHLEILSRWNILGSVLCHSFLTLCDKKSKDWNMGTWRASPPHREPPATTTVGVARGAGTLRYLSSGQSGWWPVWLTAMSSGKDMGRTQPPPAQHCVWNAEHQCPSVTRGPSLTPSAAPRVKADAHRPQPSPSRDAGPMELTLRATSKHRSRRADARTHERMPVTSGAHSMHPALKGSLQAMLRAGATCCGACL